MKNQSVLISWNLNSINARLPRLVELIKKDSPDFLCLQELKCIQADFPFKILEDLGYHCYTFCQKRYNGVAILSKYPLTQVQEIRLTPFIDDARLISANFNSIKIFSLYLPNGREYNSQHYIKKLEWMDQLKNVFQKAITLGPTIIAGDFNIAPADIDVHDPSLFVQTTHTSPEERKKLDAIMDLGYIDSLRAQSPEEKIFSWWDYRSLGFPLNKGLRIDMILTSKSLHQNMINAKINRDMRKGSKPSDHAPCYFYFDSKV